MKIYFLFVITLFITTIFGQITIVINEINYNSMDTIFNPEDWIEFYNPTDDIINMTNWEFKDENDLHIYSFNEGEQLRPGEYLVLCKDVSIFSLLFPNVDNFIGNMTFGFNGDSELLRLFAADGILVDSVYYGDSAPWPSEPDGNGPTLELIDPFSDNALAENWAGSEGYGTPGSINSVSILGNDNGENLTSFSLRPAYPNPFNASTRIEFTVPVESRVSLRIYDIAGREVFPLADDWYNSGRYSLNWAAGNISSGVYFVKMAASQQEVGQTGEFINTQKLMLIK